MATKNQFSYLQIYIFCHLKFCQNIINGFRTIFFYHGKARDVKNYPFANVIFLSFAMGQLFPFELTSAIFLFPSFCQISKQIPNLQMDIVCHFKFYLNRRNHIRLGQRKAPIVILEYWFVWKNINILCIINAHRRSLLNTNWDRGKVRICIKGLFYGQ